ncbi:hypothetical protein ACFX2H_043748 [Malus domestica]
MSDAFTDLANVTRSHIPVENAPARMDIPIVRHNTVVEGRTIPEGGAAAPPTRQDETCWPLENREISVHYTVLDELWNRNEVIVDDAFSYTIASDIIFSDDIEPHSDDECRHRMDLSNLKQAIQIELDSLAKRKVFGQVAPTPPHMMLIGYK